MTDNELADKLLGKWSDRSTQIIARNLALLLSILRGEVREDRIDGQLVEHNVIHVRDEFKRDATEHVIANQISIQGITTARTKKTLVERAALRLQAAQQSGVEPFRLALAQAAQVHLTRPNKRFDVVMPLNAKPPASAQRQRFIRVFDARLRKCTWSSVARQYDIQRWLGDLAQLAAFEQQNFKIIARQQPFVVTATAKDEDEAVASATDAFELWRSVLNILDHIGTYSDQIGGSPRPFAQFLPPLAVGVFDQTGKYLTFFYNSRTYHSEWPADISQDLWVAAQRQIAMLRQPRSDADVMSIVIEAHKKVGAALDADDWRLAFLELWQVLEVMTCRDRSGQFRMEDVRDRAKRLLCEQQLLIDLLSAAYDARNKLVHRGRFSDEGRLEVSMLKTVVEYCLNVLLAVSKVCPTWHDLELFYNHAGYTRTELDTTIRVSRWLDKLKSEIESMAAAPPPGTT